MIVPRLLERVTRAPASPDDGIGMRTRAYHGNVTLYEGSTPARDLAADVRARLEHVLGGDPRYATDRSSERAFFEAIGALRRDLFLDPAYHRRAFDVAASIGFDPARTAIDPLRLRVVAHKGEENPAAKAVYYAHRDVWYGHPASLLVAWIPLFDTAAEETFVFYPDWFYKEAPNDSETFDYDAWVAEGDAKRIGWQDPKTGLTARYPGLTGAIDVARTVGFSCLAGDTLLFSGAHLHETRRHAAGRTRYSLDFRVVDLDDHASGHGARLVDARSRGSALPHYIRVPA